MGKQQTGYVGEQQELLEPSSGGHWQVTQQKNSWTADEDGYPPGAPGTPGRSRSRWKSQKLLTAT